MTDRTDYERMAAVYDAGRDFPAEWMTGWRDALAPHLEHVDAPVLDVGAGTGIWSLLLAEWFGAGVVGLEPSAAMRSVAAARRAHPLVRYVAGQAEHLPLRSGSCAAAWLSTVVHHFHDRAGAAREIRRVVRPGGAVLVRNAFSGRTDGVPWLRFFPSAPDIAERRWPTLAATTAMFEEQGFSVEELVGVEQISARDLNEYADRVAMRADSTLTLIDDAEFERGIERIREAATRQEGPVVTVLDLLVMR